MISGGKAWNRRTVFVTGCSGFFGGWLVPRLCENGARVIGLSRSEAPRVGFRDRIALVQGSLADYALLHRTVRECEVDTIFHLAAHAQVDRALEAPAQTFETNIQGTWNLLEAARNAGRTVQVVVASTDMVYADSGEAPYTEGSLIDGSSPYAVSKVSAELLARCYHRIYGLPVCVARTSNLYGGGDWAFQRIIPGTIRAVLRSEVPVINSDGRPERDYLYVEDAVSGYMLLAAAMERPEICGETFNFSAVAPVSVLLVVETILKLMERTDLTPQVLGKSANEVAVRHSSSSRALQELGWSADSSLESGLKKTIAWYRAHSDEVQMQAQN